MRWSGTNIWKNNKCWRALVKDFCWKYEYDQEKNVNDCTNYTTSSMFLFYSYMIRLRWFVTNSYLNIQTKNKSHFIKMGRHKHLMFRGGSSWHDTDKLAMNISVIMLYVVGLLSFQKITGLMDIGKPTQVVKLHPQHKVYDAYETKQWVSRLDPELDSPQSPILRLSLIHIWRCRRRG